MFWEKKTEENEETLEELRELDLEIEGKIIKERFKFKIKFIGEAKIRADSKEEAIRKLQEGVKIEEFEFEKVSPFIINCEGIIRVISKEDNIIENIKQKTPYKIEIDSFDILEKEFYSLSLTGKGYLIGIKEGIKQFGKKLIEYGKSIDTFLPIFFLFQIPLLIINIMKGYWFITGILISVWVFYFILDFLHYTDYI